MKSDDVFATSVSVSERLVALREFDLATCRKALDTEGLQVSVDKALRARIRRMIKEQTVMVIEFADHGQDFLEWHLDAEGYVIDSAQGWLWIGRRVFNMAKLKPGGLAVIAKGGEYIKYPLTAVRRVKEGATA